MCACPLIVWRWGSLCQGGPEWERCYNKYRNVGSSQRRKMEESYPADTARGWVEHSAASLQNACDFYFGCRYYLTLECTVNLSVASAAATSINPVSWIEKLLYHLTSSLHCLLFLFRIFFFYEKECFLLYFWECLYCFHSRTITKGRKSWCWKLQLSETRTVQGQYQNARGSYSMWNWNIPMKCNEWITCNHWCPIGDC